ncbi:50S ribosomal protein L28 [Candidatus Woesebacteria bacterium]|nr:50S ribosomal protein L28 [Candidatus Woesebacteria bacterium]
MARCYITGKGNLYGRSHTHHRGVAGGRWKKRAPKTARLFKPNLQTVSIMELGVRKQVRVSAKALKRVKKDIADGKKPVIALITSQGTK